MQSFDLRLLSVKYHSSQLERAKVEFVFPSDSVTKEKTVEVHILMQSKLIYQMKNSESQIIFVNL